MRNSAAWASSPNALSPSLGRSSSRHANVIPWSACLSANRGRSPGTRTQITTIAAPQVHSVDVPDWPTPAARAVADVNALV